MPRRDYKTCKVCGRHADDVGPMSHTRLCAEHSFERFAENLDDLTKHTGHYYEHWARRVLMSAHKSLVNARNES